MPNLRGSRSVHLIAGANNISKKQQQQQQLLPLPPASPLVRPCERLKFNATVQSTSQCAIRSLCKSSWNPVKSSGTN
ncbi:hypothetical protein TYRP_019115 [Tyrophagus putrescentiae]|nr:hypothetical protein TYRP_019115 [Tyrophagus putrescentiae]